MSRGQRNKAQRGELALRLPVGLEYDPLTQSIRLAIDQSVQHVVELVFTRFRQLRSVRAVLHALVRDGVELPYQQLDRLSRSIAWRPPTYDALYLMLTNPSYAGVYSYGRRQRESDPLAKTTRYRRRRAREDWLVFIPDHHAGYITLAEFDTNQAILENNRMQHPSAQGAAGRGPALLQGLVVCQHCGQRMRVCYHRSVPYYVCDRAHRRRAAPICNRASAQRVDTLVEELLLSVVNQETLEASLAYDQHLRAEAELVDRGWQEKLQRLSYQADLARRRYELVDPANRLVAHTLETEWNSRLLELEAARNAYATQQLTPQELTSTREQIQEVITHLRDYWYAATITDQEKKELLRCLLMQVRLERQGPLIRAQVEWQGGAVTELDVPQYLFSSPAIYHRIQDLACSHTDTEIAALLNAEGVKTAKGRVWTARHVMDFRRSNAIASGFTTTPILRLPESAYLTSAEAAERLGICQATVQKWYKLGVLQGRHAGGQAQLWIQWTDDLEERLSGRATPDPRMVSVRSLCNVRGQGPDEVLAWAQAQGHTIYRLRRGTAMRFYVAPGLTATDTSATDLQATRPEATLEGHQDAVAAQEAPGPVATLVSALSQSRRPITEICTLLRVSKAELQALIQGHYDELIRQGVQLHVATKREVPEAIRLPSVLNSEEYTYYSKLSRPDPESSVSGACVAEEDWDDWTTQ
jgi:hypothetical protein